MLLDPLVLRGGVSGTSESTNEEDKVHTVHSSNGHYFNYHLSLKNSFLIYIWHDLFKVTNGVVL